MVRAQLCAILGIVMLCAASTSAREVVFSVENRIGGDSNVFRQSDDEESDGFAEIVPQVRVRERNAELNYDFWYAPTYEGFFTTNGISGWNQDTGGEIEWRVTPRDTIGATERFSETRLVRLETTEAFDATLPVVEESDRERVRRAYASLYYSHQFSPDIGGRVQFDFSDVDYSTSENVDTRAFGGSLSTTYALSERSYVGLYGSGRYRQNLGVGLQSSSTSAIGNVAFTLSTSPVENFEIFLQVGPSIIRTMEEDRNGQTVPEFNFAIAPGVGVGATPIMGNSCNFQGQDLLLACVPGAIFFDPSSPPTFTNPSGLVTLGPPADASGKSDTDISYFAEARLTKKWQRSKMVLSYTRSESGSGGVATSSIIDALAAWVSVRPAEGWTVTTRVGWSQRKTVSAVEQSVVAVVPGGVLVPDPVLNPTQTGFQFARAASLATVVTANGGNQNVKQWNVSTNIERRLTKQITLLGRVWFSKWDSESVGREFSTETIFGYVGFRYEFDPVKF